MDIDTQTIFKTSLAAGGGVYSSLALRTGIIVYKPLCRMMCRGYSSIAEVDVGEGNGLPGPRSGFLGIDAR